MTTLAQYDRARAALAEATRIEQVLPLLDEFELAKVRAKQIKDQALLADATEFQLRAERRLGEVLQAAKTAGLFTQGRQPERKSSEPELSPPRPTLAEAGIDKKLSARAQQRASIAQEAFEKVVQAARERIASGRAKIIEPEPVNGARAIMGSRQEPDDSLDYFPTPPWATRALVEVVMRRFGVQASFHAQRAWEPACGEGHMAEVLREYFGEVTASDIHDYGYGHQADFLDAVPGDDGWIITNPPFGDKGEAFVLRALEFARVGVAMFLRLQWLETIGRYERVFKPHPPAMIAQFAERVPLHKGRWEPDGSTATAYLWIVWLKARASRTTEFFWIPPGQREALTRPDDAERFTAHPVIRKAPARPADAAGAPLDYDLDTGEVIEPPDPQPTNQKGEVPQGTECAPQPGPEPPHAVPARAAGRTGDDDLDIPAFLRRNKDNSIGGAEP